jgi:hypothetical protein
MNKSDIWPGDFFSTRRDDVVGRFASFMTKTPQGSRTRRFHFGVIADPVYNQNGDLLDFETRESISKGPSTLRFLERNVGKDIELYRLPGITPNEGKRAVRAISRIGDKGYGYADIVEAVEDVVWLLARFKFPPYTPAQFKFSKNQVYICTELPAYAARAIGRPVEPPDDPDVWAIPALYLQAIEEGRLIRYYHGDLNDIV